MAKMIFVNLPVKDVAKSTAFYEAIGFTKDPRFSNEMASAMQWSDEIPDYMFGPDKVAFWMESGAAKGDMRRVLRFHHMLSSAAYQVQHQVFDPEKDALQMEAKTIAAIDGLLRAYESLKDKRPENRSEALDNAIAMRDQGKLAAFVQSLPAGPKR